jgi:uncharacterized protein (DUF2249 family)
MDSKIHTLDVREDFRSGQHPFNKIQNALGNVGPGESLRLLVPFEPVPLFHVAASKGLGHTSRQTTEGYWEILFSHATVIDSQPGSQTKSNEAGCGCHETGAVQVEDVDARGLEPPQPMVRILEVLADLPRGAKLRARTDRRPVHLYSHLEDRGFVGESEEQKDGSFITHIRHA